MPYFVFLEFNDPKVRSFLSSLREALQQRPSRTPVHITVRGPYEEAPPAERVNELRRKLNGQAVRLKGVGAFESSSVHTVFLKAESSIFREIWWKSDFPTAAFGMHPHVTLFESRNKADARAVASFLRKEQIEIYTRDVDLSVHETGQGDLFGSTAVKPTTRVRGLDHLSVTQPGLLVRATALGARLAAPSRS